MISDFVACPLWAAGVGTFNAGMFSTAEDLAKLMCVYLRGGVCDNGTRLWGVDEMAQIAPSPTEIRGADPKARFIFLLPLAMLLRHTNSCMWCYGWVCDIIGT